MTNNLHIKDYLATFNAKNFVSEFFISPVTQIFLILTTLYIYTVHSAMPNEDHMSAGFHIGKRHSLSLPGLMALS